MKHIIYLFAISFLFLNTASAGELEVEADDSLEWHRDKQLYVAKGNAKAIQDGQSILADTIYAHYNETEDKEINIWKIEAEDNVVIEDMNTKIIGDKGVYNIKQGVFTITGDNLDVLSDGYQIKANERIDYFEKDNKVIAIGDVIVYQEDNEMYSDKLTALLGENSEGEMEVFELFSVGNVVIITPTDKITGDEGYYNMKTEVSEVEGGVVIARENSVIIGDKATVNMKTGIAKMISTSKKAKVKAIFVTEDKN